MIRPLNILFLIADAGHARLVSLSRETGDYRTLVERHSGKPPRKGEPVAVFQSFGHGRHTTQPHGGGAERPLRLALQRHGVAVEDQRQALGRARHVEQDAGDRAAPDRADMRAEQDRTTRLRAALWPASLRWLRWSGPARHRR